MSRFTLLCAAFGIATGAAELPAQVRLPSPPPIRQLNGPAAERTDSQVVPPAYRPPPGMCRIWLDGVPPAQQPAPTNCASAVRNRPNNGRVIFGDDYVKAPRNERGKDAKRQPADSTADGKPETKPDGAELGATESVMLAYAAERPRGPWAEDGDLESFEGAVVVQPPARRPDTARAPARAPARRDADDEPRDMRSVNARRAAERADRRDSIREEERTRRDDWEGRRGVRRPDDRRPDDRGRDSTGPRDERDSGFRDGVRSGYPASGANGRYGAYDPRYTPPGRANGVCLDRDGDGWCDDSRTGGGYCTDRDGDGRCDDYPELASAPFSSALPPMRAAADVERGYGSSAALRWLGTSEVSVRTTDLRRTGTPSRAVWMDASTGRILQVWTDRNGDGIADRVELYRGGRIYKTIGR